MHDPTSPNEERIVTNERLRILGWCYYISGALGAFFACIFLIYALIVGAISMVPSGQPQGTTAPAENATKIAAARPAGEAPPAVVFRIVAGVLVCMTLAGWALAGLTAYAGRCIHKRKHRVFVNVMAAYNTLWIPYGTALGVFTFLVVNSADAARQFAEAKGKSSCCA